MPLPAYHNALCSVKDFFQQAADLNGRFATNYLQNLLWVIGFRSYHAHRCVRGLCVLAQDLPQRKHHAGLISSADVFEIK